MATASTARPPRRRRSPAEAEREILDAAERVLRASSPAELTVSRVMDATTLSRNSFYVYFRDRHDLVARLVERLRAEADATMADYAAAPTPPPGDAGRAALAAAARLYARHGELLRALHDAAAQDASAARAWAAFAERSEAAITERVREEIRAGTVEGVDAEPTVRALVAMNRACFFEQIVGHADADVDALVDVLHTIWSRVLYGTRPA